MRGRTPDRFTVKKGDPNAEHPGRSRNVQINERPWVASTHWQKDTKIHVTPVTRSFDVRQK